MAQYNLFNPDDVRVGLLLFFEYGASMAQYNLFNSDDVRVGLLLFFRIWNEHGAIEHVF